MTDTVPVVSQVTNTVTDVSVTAAYSGNGAAVNYSTASVAARLMNMSQADDIWYRIDSGAWVQLTEHREASFAINFATQTLTLKRGEFTSASISARVVADGVPAGLYAQGAAGPAAADSGITEAALPAALAALGVPTGVPDPQATTIGYVLKVVGGRPTWAQVVALRPELLAMGWTANHDYQTAQGQSDVVQLLKPAGSANLFIAEVTGVTGGSEPNWASAPNVGNTVVDNAVTWYNVMAYSAFPPTPTMWMPSTAYATGALVWPTLSNGRLHIAFPPGHTSHTAEPSWATTNSVYASDAAGYWMNLGLVAGLDNILAFVPDRT